MLYFVEVFDLSDIDFEKDLIWKTEVHEVEVERVENDEDVIWVISIIYLIEIVDKKII